MLWIRIRIRMYPATNWKIGSGYKMYGIWAYLSNFSRFWAFIWKLESGSGSWTAWKWKVGSGSASSSKWQAGSGSRSASVLKWQAGSATLFNAPLSEPLFLITSTVVVNYIILSILFFVHFWLPFLFNIEKSGRQKFPGFKREGNKQTTGLSLWCGYMCQIAWKRGHRSPHRRGGPTSVMPTGQNVLI